MSPPEVVAPAPSKAGCLLYPLAVVAGFLVFASVFSAPLVLLIPDRSMGEGMRIALAGTSLLQALFWGYVLRGLRRAIRGEPDSHLIPPWLLRPLAFVLGLAFTVTSIASVWGTGRVVSSTSAIGPAFIVFALARRKKSPTSSRPSSRASDTSP
jgi:hypothetical protein